MYHIALQAYDADEQVLVCSDHAEPTLEDAIVSAALHAVGTANGFWPCVQRALMRTDFSAIDVTDRVSATANELFAAYTAATKY